MPIKTYNRLSDCNFFVPGDAIEIWYAKPKFFIELSLACISEQNKYTFDFNAPQKTHVLLGSFDRLSILAGGIERPKGEYPTRTEIVERLMNLMQAERWSAHDEAVELIKMESCSHTSFSVGDMIMFKSYTPKPEAWIAKNIGWLCFSAK